MQLSEHMSPTSRAIVLRSVLVAAGSLAVLFMGAVGMNTLFGLRQPPRLFIGTSFDPGGGVGEKNQSEPLPLSQVS